MDTVRPDAVAARVVAWHNRHPLARRITAAQVESVGIVALPFLRDGDTVPPAAGPPKAERAYSEDFIPPLRVGRVARWARRHGSAGPPPADLPLREVLVDPARAAGNGDVFYLHTTTAAIVAGGRRLRLLVGPGDRPAIIGPRHWSLPRVGGVLAALVLVAFGSQPRLPTALLAWAAAVSAPAPAGDAVVAQAEDTLDDPSQAPHAAETEAAPEAAADPPPEPQPGAPQVVPQEEPSGDAEAGPAAGGSDPAASSAAEPLHLSAADDLVAAPTAVEPPGPPPQARVRRGRVTLPTLVPALDDELKARARELSEAARAQRPAAAPPPALVVAAAPAVATVPPGAPAWALATRPMRSRAESEQVMLAVRAWLAQGGAQVQVELMPAGADWRVVAWPFAARADAEKMRSAIVSRGLKVETVEF